MRAKNEETKKKIYEFINEYIQTNRVSPTVREIASGTNCAVSTAYKFMVRLQEEGLIDIAGRRHIVSSVNSWAMKSAPFSEWWLAANLKRRYRTFKGICRSIWIISARASISRWWRKATLW